MSYLEKVEAVSCLLQFRSNDILLVSNIYCEGNQCRRNINIIEGSGHRVLTTDTCHTQLDLCGVSTQKCCEGLRPTSGIFRHSSEVLLEGEVNLMNISTSCCNLGNRRQTCILSTMERRPGGQVRIISIGHHGNGITGMISYRKLCDHGLGFCQLILTAERHKYAGCTDGTIEHLDETLLGCDIKIRQSIKPCCLDILLLEVLFYLLGSNLLEEVLILIGKQNFYLGLLMSTIGIDEGTGEIHYFLSSPGKNHSRLFRYDGNFVRL